MCGLRVGNGAPEDGPVVLLDGIALDADRSQQGGENWKRRETLSRNITTRHGLSPPKGREERAPPSMKCPPFRISSPPYTHSEALNFSLSLASLSLSSPPSRERDNRCAPFAGNSSKDNDINNIRTRVLVRGRREREREKGWLSALAFARRGSSGGKLYAWQSLQIICRLLSLSRVRSLGSFFGGGGGWLVFRPAAPFRGPPNTQPARP